MTPKCPGCPIAGACKAYSALCANHAANPDRWRPVVERHNGVEPSYPPLLEQVGNALHSALTFVKKGCKIVDQAEFDRRHSICEGCDRFDAKRNRCRDCSCHMGIKPWGRDMKCPLGRWETGE